MRRDVNWMLAAALSALLAGCAGTGGGPAARADADGGDRPRKVEDEMTRTGLANLRLAQTYLGAGKLDLALDRADRAVTSDPGSPDVQLVLGMIRDRLGDPARAGAHFARAVKLGPTLGYVLNANGAWLCENGKVADADAMFVRAIRDPFYAQKEQAFFNAGKCALRAGDLPKAEGYLREGLAVAPESPRLLEQMAQVKFRQGEWFAARAFFQRRDALGNPGGEMLDLAARIEAGAGDAVAAERYRARLKQQYPDYTPLAADGTQ